VSLIDFRGKSFSIAVVMFRKNEPAIIPLTNRSFFTSDCTTSIGKAERVSCWSAAKISCGPCTATRAASSTASIRPRTRDAVSGFTVHSCCSTSITASVVTSSTGVWRKGAAYWVKVIAHCARCLALRQPDALASSKASATCPNVLRPSCARRSPSRASIGSTPQASRSRNEAAISRALASGTELTPPRPASRCRPALSNMKVQRFEPAFPIVR